MKKNFLITAGPTREFIDPFRFISNPSSGKMGYALARSAQAHGKEVVLVSGPVTLSPPSGVTTVPVTSAREMREAVHRFFDRSDVVIMAAAVSDYRPIERAEDKIKKNQQQISLTLERTPDILEELGKNKGKRILIGFSAETDNIIDNARRKMEIKNLDMIMINDLTAPGSGFAGDTNKVILLQHDGSKEFWPLLSKQEVADRIIDKLMVFKPD